ncbi:hypothetical protein FACS1894152_0190 [Bacilli bacterium]|nr:hypothetical protein FACS1894152_0190 [Bacilli bacterium]
MQYKTEITITAGRKNRKKKIVYDKEVYRLRGRIETIFGKIKESRRLAVRYEKSDIVNLILPPQNCCVKY